MRIVYEKVDTVKTISIGIWILAGSRYENKNNNGVSHFIEHMLFKGTKNRSAKSLVYEIESIGGQLNAFTAKEYTCFYARVLDEFVEKAFEILSDLLLNPLVNEEDIEKEKGVIIEEINMGKEDPEEILYQALNDLIWKGNALSYPIIGKEKTISKMERELLLKFMEERYIPKNMVISVAGNFNEDNLISLANKYLGNWKQKAPKENHLNNITPKFNPGCILKNKKIDQTQLAIAFEGFGQQNIDVYKLLLISNILGGGMSSRLFQKIREELGLVYAINSFISTYKEVGTFIIYAGMNSRNLYLVFQEILNQIKLLKEGLITSEEVAVAKQQIKGNIIFGLENTSSRMSNLGKNMLLLEKVMDLEQIVETIDSIKYEDVIKTAQEIFSKEFAISIVGNKKDIDTSIFEKREID